MQRTRQFFVEQQAQFATDIQQIRGVQAQFSADLEKLKDITTTLSEASLTAAGMICKMIKAQERVDRSLARLQKPPTLSSPRWRGPAEKQRRP